MNNLITKKIDAHTHIQKERLSLTPSFTDAIKIELTSRCNYNCSFCYLKNSPRPKGDIDKDFLYRILHEAKALGVKEIGMFLLGESFLLPELAEYIKYAKEEVGIEYVFLTTNGFLATQQGMIPIIEAGLDSIKFSINAGTRERYMEMHNIDAFEKVVSHVKWLYKYLKGNNITSLHTCVSSIFTDVYTDELESFRKIISEYVDEFYYLPFYNQAGHVGGKNYTKIIGNPGRLEKLVPPVPCWELFNSCKITWNGWMTACCFDHDSKFEIADLNKVSLAEAWNHPKFVELRRQHLENDLKNSLCAKCLCMKSM